MERLRNSKGFTLIELVLIIVILGILAVTAIPRFLDLQDDARCAAERGVVGAIRGGIAIFHASALINNTADYPTELDSHTPVAAANSANLLFNNVLEPGVDDGWSKSAVRTYDGECTKNFGGSVHAYTYDSALGTFQ